MNEIQLHRKLFPLKYIRMTIEAYSGICKVQVTEEENYYICTFRDCIYDSAQTVMEFENYLIGSVAQYDH